MAIELYSMKNQGYIKDKIAKVIDSAGFSGKDFCSQWDEFIKEGKYGSTKEYYANYTDCEKSIYCNAERTYIFLRCPTCRTVFTVSYFEPRVDIDVYSGGKYALIKAHDMDKTISFDQEHKAHIAPRINQIKSAEKCPVCGELLRRVDKSDSTYEKVFYSEKLYSSGLYASSGIMSEQRYQDYLKSLSEKKVDGYLASCDVSYPLEVSAEKIKAIKADTESLKDYLSKLISLELTIHSLGERLKTLYANDSHSVLLGSLLEDKYLQFLGEQKVQEKAQQALQAEIDNARKQHQNSLKKLSDYEKGIFDLPMPQKPREPILRESNFFNRKKVEAENKAALEKYHFETTKYEDDLKMYHTTTAQMLLDARKNADTLAQKLDSLIQNNDRNSAGKSIAQKLSEIDRTPYLKAKGIIFAEIEKNEAALKTAYENRNKLYAMDIVFIKYRNIIALMQFYEYLIAGRCSSLEGANGAYNIYETELRTDLIIGKLNEINTKLDQVIANQQMLYTSMKDVNAQLSSINKTMNESLATLESINDNTKLIAYNTAETAYYAKVTATLTDSLGYLIAMK